MALVEPVVRIRELRRDGVNFVLENVDLSYVMPVPGLRACLELRIGSQTHSGVS